MGKIPLKYENCYGNVEVYCEVNALSIADGSVISDVCGKATFMKFELNDESSLRMRLSRRLQIVIGMAVIAWVGIAAIAGIVIL